MKLHEVTSFKQQKAPEPLSDYQARLRDMRIKRLGSGAYSSVYQHPKIKRIVVKVGEEESGALAWLRFASRNQDNPYVPKIYGMRRYKDKDTYFGNYFIVFIERLTEYYKLPLKQKLLILQKHLGPYVTKKNMTYDIFINLAGDRDTYIDLFAQHKRLGVPSKYLLDVFRFLLTTRGEYGEYDIRDANIMLRGKSQIVFTDPLE
jgi:hypothetical protein